MKKSILGAAALAMIIGLTAVPLTAAAKDRTPELMMMADTDKDGMVSRQEYLDAIGKMYDEKMAKMKKMKPAEMGKMMKGDLLTTDGLRAMQLELLGGQ